MPTKPSLTLTRRLDAPPARVFDAWTRGEHIVNWFGPAETVAGTVKAQLDVKAGGSFHVTFKSVNGERHEVSGIYREVVANEKLVFTWAWRSTPDRESLVTVLVEPDGDGTLLTLRHEKLFDEAARDGHLYGWGGALNKLERYVSLK